jgi:hypothetical protein
VKVEGECHCGAIAYEAEVEPGTVGVCHCLDCQRLTGSAFRANMQLAAGRTLRQRQPAHAHHDERWLAKFGQVDK